MSRTSLLLFLSLLLAVCAGCSNPPSTPEDEIRQLISTMEDAVREKQIGSLKQHISESYNDEENRDKNALKGIFAYYFLQNRSIHLLTRVESIELPRPGTAEVALFVAMAGRRIADVALLHQISADLYRFDGTFMKEEDGIWRLVEASWHPATTEDFR